MQGQLPALCYPVATHASTWDPVQANLSVPLNVQIDGRIVPSASSPDGARVDFSHVVVLDDLFGEDVRAGLWNALIGSPLRQGCASQSGSECAPLQPGISQQQLSEELGTAAPDGRNAPPLPRPGSLLEAAPQGEPGAAAPLKALPDPSHGGRCSQGHINTRALLQTCDRPASIPDAALTQDAAEKIPRPATGMCHTMTAEHETVLAQGGDQGTPAEQPMCLEGGRSMSTCAALEEEEAEGEAAEQPPRDRWDRRTADRNGLPGTWGLLPHMLALLASGQLPAAVEVQTRLSRLYPEYIVAHMPTDAIEVTRTDSFASNEHTCRVEGSMSPTSFPLQSATATKTCQTARTSFAAGNWGVQQNARHSGADAVNHSSATPGDHQHQLHLPVGTGSPLLSLQDATCTTCSATCDPADHDSCTPETCSQNALEPSPRPAPQGHCSAFLGNAAVHGDTFQWHVDADPSDFPAPSQWTEEYGQYCNREPGKPLFVSLLLYLDAGWPRDFAAETLFLDADTDVGFAVRPRPYRAIIMDQDVLHRVSAPSQLAGSRPRYSLVWKLVLFPRNHGAQGSIARCEWGVPSSIGSAAHVQQIMRKFARKRKSQSGSEW